MSGIIRPTGFTALLKGGHAKWAFRGLRLLLATALLAALASTVAPVPKAYAATTRTIAVDNVADNNPAGGCTLREAIEVANAGLGAGTAANGCTVTESGAGAPIAYEINLPAYTYTLTGAAEDDSNVSGDLDIMASVAINGAGAGSTIIDGRGIDRVLDVPIAGLGITVTISNLTVQNGRVTGYGGGGIRINGATTVISNSAISNSFADDDGGGIYTSGSTVIMSNSIISGNSANGYGGGIYTSGGTVTISDSTISNNVAGWRGGGGGIYNGGTVTISNSTIANNNAIGYYGGGGIDNSGTVTIANSTISGNFANSDGGGIASSGTANLTNVTIANNIADTDDNGFGDGGGIYSGWGSTINIKNTIVAGNSDRSGGGPDCYGTFVSQQYNLIGINTGCIISFPGGKPNGNNDFVGTGGIPLDPILGLLAYNGGDTWTHALLPGSPAIGVIPVSSCPLSTDQRGIARPYGAACDIGAYERVPELTLSLTKKADDDTPLQGQVITYTVSVENSGDLTATNALISDTLPAGLIFAGPIALEPPGVGSVGVYPILAHSLTITVGQHITVTFPVTVQTDAGGRIANTAVITSPELIAPQAGSVVITVVGPIYLPLVLRNYTG